MLSTQSVANYFIEKYSKGKIPDLTPMKLQKMIFLAHSWNATLFNTFLIDDHFAMWKTGPVIPSLYHKIKFYRDLPVEKYITNNTPEGVFYERVSEKEIDHLKLLNKITESYGHLSGAALASLIMNHYPGMKENDCFNMDLLKIYPEKVIYQNILSDNQNQEKQKTKRL